MANDLLSSSKKSDYTAEDIQVLEGLEPVRHRPGMYIGGTDTNSLHHLVSEIVDNSMDEVVAGHATEIQVHLSKDNIISIRDNGRGIPIDSHPKFPNKSALEVILTTLHSGGKFKEGVYEVAGGLHGVGLSVVNALSDYLKISVYRKGMEYTQSYSKGLPQTKLEEKPAQKNIRGTLIEFHPDESIFKTGHALSAERVFNLLRSKAYLHKGVKIKWSCDEEAFGKKSDTPTEHSFLFPNGIQDFMQTYTNEKEILFEHAAEDKNEACRMEWAIAWLSQDAELNKTYCNTIPTPLGGTHEMGFRNGFVRSIKNFGELIGVKKVDKVTADDIFNGCLMVLSVFIKNPQFQGQTKEKLVVPTIQKNFESLIKDHMDQWLLTHKALAQDMLQFFIERAEDRLLRRQEKEVTRSSATRKLRLPGKLTDCSRNTPNDTELFLVEGDSAGGSAKQARKRETQAILPLRGKILNVATATPDKMLANQEVQNLIQAMGCGYGKNCDSSKLRYERIIVMTDADVDGAHISSLLMTFFFQQMRPVIENGHLFLAQPPLYRLAAGGNVVYARDDAHKNKILSGPFKKYTNIDISRFKGLGEMNASQLKETTMDPNNRSLIKVLIRPNDDTEQFVERLMGKKVEDRLHFIQSNAEFAKQLDI